MTRKDINVILEGYLMSNVQFVTLNSTKLWIKKSVFIEATKEKFLFIWFDHMCV